MEARRCGRIVERKALETRRPRDDGKHAEPRGTHVKTPAIGPEDAGSDQESARDGRDEEGRSLIRRIGSGGRDEIRERDLIAKRNLEKRGRQKRRLQHRNFCECGRRCLGKADLARLGAGHRFVPVIVSLFVV